MLDFLKDLYQDLFNRKKSVSTSASSAVETAPLSEVKVQSSVQPQTPKVKLNPAQLVVGTAQSVGMQRDHNEDTLFAMHAILADGNNDVPFGVFIVADGMGGHLNGEVASGTAARTLGEYLINRFYLPFLVGQPSSESIQEVLETGVSEAQRAVIKNAPGGGTTLTAALIIGDRVTLSHVGDSRAYFIYPDGRIEAMTQDHSLVRRLQDLGQIDEKEASIHPQRNVLYRALGQSEPFRPDINTYTLPNAGYLLICSDGLWGSVPDIDINRIVQTAPNPSLACHQLIEAANAAGGPDNISAVLVQFLG